MAAKDTPNANNLDKVRDLLFGEQSRAADKRFARLETKLSKETEALRADILKRLDSLEQYTKKEPEALGARVSDHQADTAEMEKEVDAELAALAKDLDKRAAVLADEQHKATAELRKQLLAQTKTLRDELSARTDELSEEVDAEFEELRDIHVDRAALSALFADIAVKLGGKKPPAPK